MGRDLTGEKFGKWTVLEKSSKYRYWLCKCSCGVMKEVYESNMASGRSKSCRSCRKTMDLAGSTVGEWKVLHQVTFKSPYVWKCECLGCGKLYDVLAKNIQGKTSTSCMKCARKRDWDRYSLEVRRLAERCGLPGDTDYSTINLWNAMAEIGLPVKMIDLMSLADLASSETYLGLRFLRRNGLVDVVGNGLPMTFQLSIKSLKILEDRANEEGKNEVV